MDSSHDHVTLTAEERQVLTALENAVRRDDTRLGWLRAAPRPFRPCSVRVRGTGAMLLFLAGAAIMVATFTVWPLVAIAGAVLQAIALKQGLTLLAPVAATYLRRWAQAIQQNSVSGPQQGR